MNIITKIEAQKTPDRVNIYINHVFAFGLYQNIRYEYNLKKGMCLDDDLVLELRTKEEVEKTKSYALYLLNYGDNTEKMLKEKLLKKDFKEEHILEAIEYCKSFSYIDDRLYAERFIKDKVNLNKYGSNMIRYKLIEKGVSKELIEEVLNLDKDLEYENAKKLATKKLSSYKNLEDQVIKRRLSGFLQRKGYDFSIINKLLRELID